MLAAGSVQAGPLQVANQIGNASTSIASKPSTFITSLQPQQAAALQVMLAAGSVQAGPLQVANQTVNASTSIESKPFTFTTTLQPGPSSNWSAQVGVDACLDAWVMGQVPALVGNGTDASG